MNTAILWPMADHLRSRADVRNHLLLWDRLLLPSEGGIDAPFGFRKPEADFLLERGYLKQRVYGLDEYADDPVVQELGSLRKIDVRSMTRFLNLASSGILPPYYKKMFQDRLPEWTDEQIQLISTFTLLISLIVARKASIEFGGPLVTSRAFSETLFRVLAKLPESKKPRWRWRRRESSEVRGALGSLSLDLVGIAPRTPVERIVEFREDPENVVLLAKFRRYLGDLTAGLESEDFQTHPKDLVFDLMSSNIVPAVLELEECLKDNRIDALKSTLKATAFIGGVSVAALGEWALGAAVPVTLAVEALNYRNARRSILRSCPVSYLHKLKRL